MAVANEPAVPTHSTTCGGAAAGELADPLDGLVAALLDHVGRAEAARDLQPVGVMAEDDHALGPQPPGGQHGAEPDGAVADHDDGRRPSPCPRRARRGARSP